MSTLELPTLPMMSPGSAEHGGAAFPRSEYQSEDSSSVSVFSLRLPSPLEYSLREACVPELNARLRVEGFEPPGKGLAAWVRLARIVEVDAASVTVDELVEEACAWAERVRVTERIRMQVAGPGITGSTVPSQGNYSFPGSREWGNWGLGMDWKGRWHLFHMPRDHGGWVRQRFAITEIPTGIPDGLARGLVAGNGILPLVEAQNIWQQFSRGISASGRGTGPVRSPMTKLRRAIERMLQQDGHEPQGLPIVWNRTERHWRSRIRFGNASIGEKGHVWFQTGHPPETVT